ncbi:MAG: tetratricopeptide repeat protein [Gammaproteobacteria bacterium]|nr:tetratricopeptide repeat protein [Gammaproteobacteria bacterium]
MRLITLLTTLLLITSVSAAPAAPVTEAISDLQHQWAVINYQTEKDKQEQRFEVLADSAHEVSARYPHSAEPLVWEAIILSSYAGAKGGLGALSLVKQARELLLKAEEIDPSTLSGSIYTSLGSLYYQVPGWPLSFGDDDKARAYLEKALTINPDGIDPNYFYGDFLIEEGEYERATEVLKKALAAPQRANRPIADTGRKQEINAALLRASKG